MSIEKNKQVALEWLDAFIWSDTGRLKEMSSEDYVFYVPGELPMSGRYTREAFFGRIERAGRTILHPIRLKIGAITAEEDRVCVEAESKARLSNGRMYNNWYHWLITFRDGKVVSMKDYFDTIHLARTHLEAKVELPSKERESVLTTVTKTIVTSAAKG